MKKIIELTKYARLTDGEPCLIPDTLELDFNSCGYSLSRAKITLRNGEVKEQYNLTRPFEIPPQFLIAGELYITIDSYSKNGELVKHWDCLPIIIKETESGMQCFDFLYALEKKIDNVLERLEKIEKAHEIIK